MFLSCVSFFYSPSTSGNFCCATRNINAAAAIATTARASNRNDIENFEIIGSVNGIKQIINSSNPVSGILMKRQQQMFANRYTNRVHIIKQINTQVAYAKHA